ncbi:MAG: hypothetical protein AAGU14_02515 [Eubacteriaceae bacterium]
MSKDDIVAIVTTDKKKILHSGVAAFLCDNIEERDNVSLLISKVTQGMVHDLENGCVIIVRH